MHHFQLKDPVRFLAKVTEDEEGGGAEGAQVYFTILLSKVLSCSGIPKHSSRLLLEHFIGSKSILFIFKNKLNGTWKRV